jgi:hypothetical protein
MTEHGGAGGISGKKILLISVVGLILISAVTYAAGLVFNFVPAWYQNYAPEQPIPFQHKIHAGDYKIPCLYCHASAERAQHSEVPGLETCMNCHQAVKTDSPWIQKITEAYKANKPIEWVKVHVLPDFVRFNHKRHIAAGVECQTCHGPVQEMERVYQYAPLNMGWCVNCHRDNNYVQSHRVEWSKKTKELKGNPEESFLDQMLSHPDPHNADLSCSTCHY